MSKRQYKPHASSSRVIPVQSSSFGGGFGSSPSAFGSSASALSYLAEQPDLSSLSESNVVVSFKNLSKKDSTTKSKALEDLQSYLSSLSAPSNELEESFLRAWTKVYPRVAIDGSRRVRQLSHAIQGQICASIGKRIAKHLPDVVGSWLSGLHDPDRAVASSASDSLNQTFATAEKRANLRKAYQPQILEYCSNAALRESAQTLSDERTTTQEDADAKYYRVISSSVALVTDLLSSLPAEDVGGQQSYYEEFLSTAKFSDFVASPDPLVRRSILRFIKICIQKRQELALTHLPTILTALLSGRAIDNQKGSAFDYSDVLLGISFLDPSVWQSTIKGKAPAVSKLPSIFKHGSYGSGPQFWINLKQTLELVPNAVFPAEKEFAEKFLGSLHSGIIRKDEPRTNIDEGWNFYFVLAERIILITSEDERPILARNSLFPVLQQYLAPKPETSQWTIPGPKSLTIMSFLFENNFFVEIAEMEWPNFTSDIVQSIQVSAPQQSKDFEASQNAVAAQGQKWFALQKVATEKDISVSFRDTIKNSTDIILKTCFDLLRSRVGKPFGASAIVEAALQNLKLLIMENPSTMSLVTSFVTDDLPLLMFTPSRKSLVAVLYALFPTLVFGEGWDATVSRIINEEDEQSKLNALIDILAFSRIPSDFDRPRLSSVLQSYFKTLVVKILSGDLDPSNASGLLDSPAKILSDNTVAYVYGQITEGLSQESMAPRALALLKSIVKSSNPSLRELSRAAINSELLQKLLLLTESSDDIISQDALELNREIEMLMSAQHGDLPKQSSGIDVIFNSLYEAGSSSLAIETLVGLARKLLTPKEKTSSIQLQDLLPDDKKWSELLRPFLEHPIPASTSITNPLGGVVYLVEAEMDTANNSKMRDRDGYSAPLRMAIYTTKVIQEPSIFNDLSTESRGAILCLLQLTVQLVNSNLSIAGSNHLWDISTPFVEEEMLEFVSEAQKLIMNWLSDRRNSEDEHSFIHLARENLFSHSRALTTTSIHNAQAYYTLTSELLDMHGRQKAFGFDLDEELKSLRMAKDLVPFLCFISAFRNPLSGSAFLTRVCNELVADLTGSDVDQNASKVLHQLITLNIVAKDHQSAVESVAKQRVVFFARQLISWLQLPGLASTIKAEIYKALLPLLPQMSDIYSEQWSMLLDSAVDIPSDLNNFDLKATLSPVLPLSHAKLKLLSTLRGLSLFEETNDDLKEAWEEHLSTLAMCLVQSLQLSGPFPDDAIQPLRIFNETLTREIMRTPLERIENLGELYPLVVAESRPVQTTAFELLHKQIPKAQEQISLDVALGDTVARLPNELLSLIIDAPTIDSIADESFHRSMPPVLQGYLSSWLLIFDHFKNASDKLKADYATNIKDGDYLSGLLDFTFTFLGHSQGRPLDVSKFDVTIYSFDIEESPIKDVQWLLAHLYYLCLKRLPSLSKSWWIECKSRSTVVNVESWTEKFISPHIISDALETVSKWAETQDSTSDEGLIVKANHRTREVTASKEIDDQFLTMAIRLPANFPLGQAIVEPINRVAIDEKKWRSWLLSTQGVITFSNNSLVDGLIAFRRNVVGALKGQTECAICYSMVSQDKQLPTKKCGTCKNLFHGSCLYRWFKSSNSSSCPLCRNPFNYT